MKIEKNSRFYNFLYFLGKWGFDHSHPVYIKIRMPSTVCSLFWYVVAGSFLCIGKVFIVLLGIGVTSFISTGFLLHTLRPLVSFQIFDNGLLTSIATMIVWSVIGLLTLIWYWDTEHYRNTIVERRRNKYLEREENDGNTSIVSGLSTMVVGYIKSFKDKVCPVIEYTED